MIFPIHEMFPEWLIEAGIDRREAYEDAFRDAEPIEEDDWGFSFFYVRGEVIPGPVQRVRRLGTPDDYMDYVFGVSFAIVGMAVMYRISPLLFLAGLPPYETFLLGVGVSNLIQEQF